MEIEVHADLVIAISCARCMKQIRKELRLAEYNLTTPNFSGSSSYLVERIRKNVYDEATRRGWRSLKVPTVEDADRELNVCGVCLAKELDQP